MPDVPPINEVFRNLEMSSNLHLITEEPYTSAIEALMQDEMNFGILPQHDVEKFILGVEDLPLLVSHSHVKTPTVSRKRTLSSPTETPTKRSKVCFVKNGTSILKRAAITELQQGLSVIEVTELPEVKRSKKRRKLFDRQTKLSNTLMRKYIQNVTAHTIKEQPWFMPTLPSAKEYLRQPSTKIFNKLWGETLTKFFSQHFIKPLAQTVQDEFQDILFEIERTMDVSKCAFLRDI
ncbi:hypothetical protein WN51_12425 [Melipona quadrifasciata]|uniref:Uncharacterized protein n=1 Tax=Melipona quadrifasciata TaxID=166423 RepID=A0A0M9A2K8_9HYME|nr:hypothetical protein WN51_12425 [Melipona quadrifasciata]